VNAFACETGRSHATFSGGSRSGCLFENQSQLSKSASEGAGMTILLFRGSRIVNGSPIEETLWVSSRDHPSLYERFIRTSKMRRNRQSSSNSEELSEARFEDKKKSSEFFESRRIERSEIRGQEEIVRVLRIANGSLVEER
jgi:hypothetical protein